MDRSSIATTLHSSFVLPFRNKGLLGLYLSTIANLAGLTLIMIYMAYNLADEGIKTLLTYYIALPLLSNIFFMPAGFYLFSKLSLRSMTIVLFVYQLIFFAGVLMLTPDSLIVLRTLLASALTIPFWVLYHMSMLHYSSCNNRGNEVSLAHLGISVGCIIGSLAAGVMLAYECPRGIVLCVGAISIMAATTFLYFFARKNTVISDQCDESTDRMLVDIWAIISSKRLQAKATSLEMVYDVAVRSLWPIWLKVVGASGLAVGFLSALNVVIKCFISPIVGRFINQGSGQEAQNGPVLKIIGWLPWLVFAQPLTALWSSVFFAAGSHMFRVGLEARWYKHRALAPMAAREILLGFGRIFGAIVFIPILFYAPEFFVPLGIAFTVLILLTGKQLKQHSIAESVAAE